MQSHCTCSKFLAHGLPKTNRSAGQRADVGAETGIEEGGGRVPLTMVAVRLRFGRCCDREAPSLGGVEGMSFSVGGERGDRRMRKML